MTPPAPGRTVDDLLAEARAGLVRVGPRELARVRDEGALVVDVRPLEKRRRDGALPDAVVVGLDVLEWRLDPASPHRLAGVDARDRLVVLVCDEGYSSSLAAARLRALGLDATDLVDGVQGLLLQGLLSRPETSSALADVAEAAA